MPAMPTLPTESLRPSGALGALRTRAENAFWRSALSDQLLKGPLPDRVAFAPQDLIPGSLDQARAILNGTFVFGTETVTAEGARIWSAPLPSERFAEALHSFRWLRHLNASGGSHAGTAAQVLLDGWVERYGRYDHFAWRPDVLGARLVSMMRHYRLLFERADALARSKAMVAIARQCRFLMRRAPKMAQGPGRLDALIGLVHVCLALEEERSRLHWALDLLSEDLPRHVFADGGHRSRNPVTHARVLADLAGLQGDLQTAGVTAGKVLADVTGRMAGWLRRMRHGDGGLACFNGGQEASDGLADHVLAAVDGAKRAPSEGDDSGYYRMAARRTVVIFDAGTAPAPAYARDAQAGCLSFELSSGRARIVVNCGTGAGHGVAWEKALRATAAHSTLTIADRPSAAVGKAVGVLSGPPNVTGRRMPVPGGDAVVARHGGYADMGFLHERRLFLSDDGDDLRGEDRIEPAGKGKPGRAEAPWAVRFHLHPGARASRLPNGTILIKTATGEGWTLRTGTGALDIEESAYLGSGGRPRRSEQIVLSGLTEGHEAVIKWAFKRVKRDDPKP
ncbi:MAG: heparinase II/III family protein [Alphaproteobacteria bacterium]|nr:heparinase II/III family protein [Alphaproteobacteria bacterium]MDX5369561.1 heparinase II/III family protein [Alphaproteobacteria bacterium]